MNGAFTFENRAPLAYDSPMARSAPRRAFSTRDNHRTWLTLHFALLVVVVLGAFIANRFLTPDHFWAHWVALVALGPFAIHLAIFAKATLATMGGNK